MEYSNYTITALDMARDALQHMGTDRPERLSNLYADYATRLTVAFEVLDNAGVFAALDEQTDSATAEAILAEGAAIDMVRQASPNVPADKALQVLHYTWNRRDSHGRQVMVRSPETAASRLPEPETAGQASRPTGRPAQCGSCGLRVADGSEYHETCRPISD